MKIRNFRNSLFGVFNTSKTKSIRRYRYIPTYINEGITCSLLWVQISTRSLTLASISAYARRTPEYAFLLMHACACASIYENRMLTYYMYSASAWYLMHRLSLVFAFYDNFDFFSCFFSYFLPKNKSLQNSCNVLKYKTNRAIGNFNTWKKMRVILINCKALNASHRRTLVFHAQEDYVRF